MEANLNYPTTNYSDGYDSICIIRCLTDIPGGRTLDVSRIPTEQTTIRAGHVVVKTKEGNYALLGLTGDKYKALAEGESYVGVLRTAVLRSHPLGSIVTSGQVNGAAVPHFIDETIQKALPRLEFLYNDKHPKATASPII